MEDDAGPRSPMADGAVEGREREAGVFGGAKAPAEDPAGVPVHDDGEIAPGATDSQIGDVADPHLIRPRRQAIELAVGDARKEPVKPRDAAIELQRAGPEAGLAQEPADAAPAHPHARGGERAVDPRSSVRATAAEEDGLHLLEHHRVLASSRARAAAAPRVVARPGDVVERTEALHGELLALGVDEREDLRLCAEENRMAFFKSSCSSCSSACSRFTAWSCLSSRADRAGRSTRRARPRSTPSRTSLRQRDSMKGWMSRALATVCTSTPGMWLSFTAVNLNSTLWR